MWFSCTSWLQLLLWLLLLWMSIGIDVALDSSLTFRSLQLHSTNLPRQRESFPKTARRTPTTITTRASLLSSFVTVYDDDKDSSTLTSSTVSLSSSSFRPNFSYDNKSSRRTFVRWKKNGNNHWDIQTSVSKLYNPSLSTYIELHALLHYGTKEYYNYYNTVDMNRPNVTSILYELLLDESLLNVNCYGQRMILHQNRDDYYTSFNIQSSIHDQQTASYYGWIPQVDGIDYVGNTMMYRNWIHADQTTQELYEIQQQHKKKQDKGQGRIMVSSSKATGVIWEATTALLNGPPLLLQEQYEKNRHRRLFTNLFLQGNIFVLLVRWILWLTIPCPEISILLIDSSSIWFDNTNHNQQHRDVHTKSSFDNNNNNRLVSSISPIIEPLIQSLFSGKRQIFRKLLFGQGIISSHSVIMNDSNHNNDDWDVIVIQRNKKALQVLQNEINLYSNDNNSKKKQHNIVMLYGCNHCPDLYDKLINEKGFYPMETNQWRTVSSIHIDHVNNRNHIWIILGSSSTLLYLTIGALDWIGIVQSVAATITTTIPILDGTKLILDLSSYIVRHVLLYVGLSRFLLDWNKT